MPPKKKGKDDKKKGGKEGELSPEDKLKQDITRLENEKSDLSLELSFVRDKLQQKTATADTLEIELLELGAKLDKSTRDYVDILEHKETQLKGTERRVHTFEQQVEQLQAEMGRMEERMSTLIAEAEVNRAHLESSAGILGQQQQLEEAARKQALLALDPKVHELSKYILELQDSVIARQEEEISSLKGQIVGLQQQLMVAADRTADLTLKSSGGTELKILFGEAWLFGVSRQRLTGEVPFAREGNTLCCFGGKLLVMYGGQNHGDGVGGQQREVNPLQLDSLAWQRPLGAKTADFINAHSAVTVARTKMMSYSGQRAGQLVEDVTILHTDSMKWVTPIIRGGSAPPPRVGHAAACCRDKVFIFGGLGEGGVLLNDMWEWHMDTLHWTPVMDFQTAGGHSMEPPIARMGASLSGSEDGRRVWLFGGNAGGASLNDLYCLELETRTWSQVTVAGNSPLGREGHAACILSRFLLISSGINTSSTGSQRRLADTHILDMATPSWECIDDGAWASSSTWRQMLAQYCVFHGNRLYMLKPSKDDKLDELQTFEFTLPEDIERMKNERRKGNMTIDTLDLMDEAVCTPSSIEVAWRPPTKNADRISKFKLMLATTTGVVKDVYQGLHTRFKSTGLRPDMEYIFCVKATYDDGSFLWSESKAFQTRA